MFLMNYTQLSIYPLGHAVKAVVLKIGACTWAACENTDCWTPPAEFLIWLVGVKPAHSHLQNEFSGCGVSGPGATISKTDTPEKGKPKY